MNTHFEGENFTVSESFFRPVDPHGGVCLLFPGQNYPTTMPVMTFLKQALAQDDWRIVEANWDFPHVDNAAGAVQFVESVADKALDCAHTWFPDFEGRTILITKSISTVLAPWAADHELGGVWLTPLLNFGELPEGLIADALARSSSPQLLIGASVDQSWSEDKALATGQDVVSLSRANHALVVPNDWESSLAILRDVVEVTLEFVHNRTLEDRRN